MDGHTLVDVFETAPVIQTIESWENVEGADGQHDSDVPMDAEASQEALEQLIALGYIERPDDDAEEAIGAAKASSITTLPGRTWTRHAWRGDSFARVVVTATFRWNSDLESSWPTASGDGSNERLGSPH